MKTEFEEAAKDYIENTMKFSFNSLETKTQANRMLKCVEFGAKWQKERMYSEEDLKEAFKGGGRMSWTDINQETQEPYYYDFNEWFEQFKKK
jgi:hypothetical protein